MKYILFIFMITFSLSAQYEWSEPVMLSEKVTWPDANFWSTNIVVDNEGTIQAFWSKTIDLFGDDYSQIMYRKSTDGGSNWSPTANLTPYYTDNSIHIGNLNVVCDSKNNLHLMFLRGTEWSKVMHMKYDGTSWTEPVSIYDYAVNYLHVAIDSNDRIYAVWWSDPSYYSYFENSAWKNPESISETYLPSIKDIIIDKNDNILACGHYGENAYDVEPIYCKYDKISESWINFKEIPGLEDSEYSSIACALTISKNDTVNFNISTGPTDSENMNYIIKYCEIDTTWKEPQYINENTYMRNKDFFSDNDDKLHLFERSTDDSSLVYLVHNGDEWIENVVQHETGNIFGRQKVFFNDQDHFYMTYEKFYLDTDERAIFFQKKQIEVGIEDSDEVIVKDCKLYQNYPNPFNSNTVIEYSIDKLSNIKLSVYNLKGELINTLVNKKQDTGKYSVQLKTDDLGSGVYYYRLEVDGIVKDTKKMLYLR